MLWSGVETKVSFYIVLISSCLINPVFAGFSDSDLNQDGIVDYLDFQDIAGLWLEDCLEASCYNADIQGNY